MEPEGSLPHSQVLATRPYPEPDQSSLCPPFHFLKIHLNIILPSTSGPPKWSLPLSFPHQKPAYTSPLPQMCYMLSHYIYEINNVAISLHPLYASVACFLGIVITILLRHCCDG